MRIYIRDVTTWHTLKLHVHYIAVVMRAACIVNYTKLLKLIPIDNVWEHLFKGNGFWE